MLFRKNTDPLRGEDLLVAHGQQMVSVGVPHADEVGFTAQMMATEGDARRWLYETMTEPRPPTSAVEAALITIAGAANQAREERDPEAAAQIALFGALLVRRLQA
jgi:hypothetical protein